MTIEYKKQYSVGELIDKLTALADEHGRDVPVGTIGHFGEVYYISEYDVVIHTETRLKHEKVNGATYYSGHTRDVPLLIEIVSPDIGEEPN